MDKLEGCSTRFKVGDRLRNVHASYLPVAVVTDITERGFKYTLERPLIISPRLGTQIGGESYEDSQWELDSRASVTASSPDTTCLLCGHSEAINGYCASLVPICSDGYHGTHLCGCKCRFRATSPVAVETLLDRAEVTFDAQVLIATRQLTKARNFAAHTEEAGEVCRRDCEGCNDPVGQIIAELRACRTTPSLSNEAIKASAAEIASYLFVNVFHPMGVGGISESQEAEIAAILSSRLGSAAGGEQTTDRPKIICLCGSTRFIEQFAITTWELEREGFIVLGCTLLPMWYCNVPSHFGEATGTKEQCDELHKRKIDLADEVLVLNIGGYIGESTASEIAYAERLGKPVRYVEPLTATPTSTEDKQT